MPGSHRKTASRWTSTSLFLLSLLGALAVCEVGLRLFHPKYEDVARYDKYRVDESRLWAPIPNTSRYRAHPDTGLRHPIIYNSFGSRQHRQFDVDVLKQAENVAVFGDSYTENNRIEAQYSFTEVLDFLLNLQGDRDFNVLNFGVDGYGPGQEFIWYEQFAHRDDLDHVLYVFCNNDIEDFHSRRLFSLDESGDLVAKDAVGHGPLVIALSRLHLTHLVRDFVQRLPFLRGPVAPKKEHAEVLMPAIGAEFLRGPVAPKKEPPRERIEPVGLPGQRIIQRKQDGAGPGDALDESIAAFQALLSQKQDSTGPGDALDESIAAFQALLSHWKELVEARGGEFRVVVLPYLDRKSVQAVFPMHLDVVYLHECFSDMIPNFHYYDWTFRSDAHWNEAGNMVAAHCLYRLLEEEAGLQPLSEAELANARHEYYAAVRTVNWSPPPEWVARPAQPTSDAARIAAKYMQLDYRRGVLELLGNSTPTARGDWDVYRLPKGPSGQAALAYAKTPCREEDREDVFFLHVTPRDPRRLSEERAIHGFDNLDFYFTRAWQTSLPASANHVPNGGWTFEDHCVYGAELPRYEIARIRTGQYTAEGRTWDVEIVFDGTAGETS